MIVLHLCVRKAETLRSEIELSGMRRSWICHDIHGRIFFLGISLRNYMEQNFEVSIVLEKAPVQAQSLNFPE